MGLVECISRWNAWQRQNLSKLLQGNAMINWLVIQICHITTLKLPLCPVHKYSLKEISFVLAQVSETHKWTDSCSVVPIHINNLLRWLKLQNWKWLGTSQGHLQKNDSSTETTTTVHVLKKWWCHFKSMIINSMLLVIYSLVPLLSSTFERQLAHYHFYY